MPERQLRLLVEYDGTDLCGWQRQDNGPTVQGHLEDALAAILQHPVRVTGASRTDAGVHARGQVAAFTTTRTIPVEGVRRGLNSLLPPAIAVARVDEVGPEFHPRFSATGKHYRYLVWNRRERAPRLARTAWHVYAPLAMAPMHDAAAILLGEHDFSAFRAVGCSARTTVRRLDAVALSRPEPDLVQLDVEGNAFLRNMVRILAGTLVEVGMGRLSPAQVAEILSSRDRTRAGQTAPAHGLELIAVRFEGRRADRRAAPATAGADLGQDV
ncbi:MAG: tRNA pseudouridine(38-40) synthase TruA [Kofleriaceae bacterium]|nr:tRNA pseudouridine(38-40) synthase TruA [Kofleriaceae bacterium]